MAEAERITIKVTDVKGKPWQKPNSNQYWYTVATSDDGEPVKFVQDRDKGAPEPEEGKEYEGNVYEDSNGGRKFYAFKLEDKSTGPAAVSRGYSKSPEEQASIYRSVALQQAVAFTAGSTKDEAVALQTAETFYEWLKGVQG